MRIDDVLEWLMTTEAKDALGDKARTGRTALRKARALPDAPDEAEWLVDNPAAVRAQLEAQGFSPAAARTYASRAATVVHGYLEWRQHPRTWKLPDRRLRRKPSEAQPRTIDEQLAEIYETLGRWPDVRDALWPLLSELVHNQKLRQAAHLTKEEP